VRIEELIKNGIVDIKPNGAILLGRNFTIDGFWKRPVRVITHAHVDHLKGLSDSIQYSSMIIATPATIELISEILSMNTIKRILFKQKTIPLDYGRKIKVEDETIELIKANHIIGSAQVLIEACGLRLGYTGDFKLKETPIMKDLDVLVIEATYGSPRYRRTFKDSVEALLLDLIEDCISKNMPIRIYGYYGKLQEVMELLRKNGITLPFIMPPKIYRITKIAVKYGYMIDNFYNIHSSEGRAIMSTNEYILFLHMSRAKDRNIDNGINIVLSGWEFNEPIKRVDRNTWLVALSDHADFDELIEYIARASPKYLVVDNSREGAAYDLALAVRKELGIDTIVLPREEDLVTNYT